MKKSASSVTVVVAIIGALGGWGTALITNYDKLFPPSTPKELAPSPNVPAPRFAPGQSCVDALNGTYARYSGGALLADRATIALQGNRASIQWHDKKKSHAGAQHEGQCRWQLIGESRWFVFNPDYGIIVWSNNAVWRKTT